MDPYQARMERGFKMLKRLGREGMMMNHKEIYPDLYKLSVGHLFGDIWTRKHLDLRDRELITLTIVIVLAYASGIQSHCRSAMHLGITKEEIMELLIQVGAYAGWPRMANAVREFGKVLEADAGKKKKNAKKKTRAKAN
jgi:4-carboxymuconolactone decarboxylase